MAKDANDMTHHELQGIAVSWLRRSYSAKGPGCQISMQEIGGLYGGERADAWGYRWGWGGGSVLVEVKVSRSDFLADAKKPHRSGEVLGMGTFRYYMCPEGMINIEDLPDGWGLLWVNGRGHVKPVAGHICPLISSGRDSHLIWLWAHKVNADLERDMMAHLLSRVGDPEELNRKLRDYSISNNRLLNELEQAKTKHSNLLTAAILAGSIEDRFREAVNHLVAVKSGEAINGELIDELVSVCDSLPERNSVRDLKVRRRAHG